VNKSYKKGIKTYTVEHPTHQGTREMCRGFYLILCTFQDNDEDKLEEDELPEWKREPPKVDLSKLDPKNPHQLVSWSFLCSIIWGEIYYSVHFVDFGGIVDHHC
jgi:hypothetical protein